MEIKDIVNVTITRETSSKTVRDLQTIAVLSHHTKFAETARRYGGTQEILEDGFTTTDFVYISANRIFSQNPQVKEILVGKINDEDNINYVNEIVNLQGYDDKWFFLITDAKDDEDKIAIAEYVETQDLFYVFADHNPDTPTNVTTDIFSKLQAKSLQHSAGIHTELPENEVSPESAWVGRFASAVIGSNAWIHKALVTLTPETISTTKRSYLKAKNAQFYTLVGQDPSVEGLATTVGGEKIFVILGCIWLKVRIAERVWSLLYSKERINYTDEGIELFKTELITVLREAVNNNILTDEDGFNIRTPSAKDLTSAERATGYLRKITFRARLAGAILFVDAIEGTVYA